MFGTSPRSELKDPHPPKGDVEITVVHAPACHFCADAEATLEQISAMFADRITVRVVAMESPEGARLITTHRPAMNPLVLLDGRFFSAGRLPRRKLTALLHHTFGTEPRIGRP